MTPPQLQFFLDPPRSPLQRWRNRLWLASRMRKVDHFIRHDGLAVVPFQLPGDREPRYSYSVGFDEAFGHPELIVFDQPWPTAADQFFAVHDALLRNELKLQDGMVWIEDATGRFVWRKGHPSRVDAGWLGLAGERRRRRTGDAAGLELFQLVASDRNGRLPWEPGYDESLRKWQPALYEPTEGFINRVVAANGGV
jgi:hypothetical protein